MTAAAQCAPTRSWTSPPAVAPRAIRSRRCCSTQRENHAEFAAVAKNLGRHVRALREAGGSPEERVIGEYVAGSEIADPDDSFTVRFLYAFWWLCEQRIATTVPAEVGGGGTGGWSGC
jgi:hypothetical protein